MIRRSCFIVTLAALTVSAASVVHAEGQRAALQRTARDTVPGSPARDTAAVHRDTLARKDTAATAHADPVQRDTTGRDTTGRDTTGRDTTGRDTLAAAGPLVNWTSDSDSVAQALMRLPGYRATRYQGDSVVFDARNKVLRIEGAPAAVGRDQTLVIGDTVLYDDSTKFVTAMGDTVILHDPSQQAADVVAKGRVSYDAAQGRGTATNISTSVESGTRYYLSGKVIGFVRDTTPARRSAYYVHDGIITSCDDSVPDYYFKSSQIKFISKNLLVARPATLYIAGVPVFWLPFLFQDVRDGRRSGILTPRFGVSEFVRSSSSYRRHVDNLGYYFNLGNYMDLQAWYDWRSSARGSTADPGYSRINGEFRYHWLDRFITGRIAGNHQVEPGGITNTSVSWNHVQDFSSTSRLSADVNFVTNTTALQQTTYNPAQQLATIHSDLRYSRKVGPFSMELGGQREQYPGRTQIQENYPSVSITSPMLGLASWLDWTPSLTYSRQATVNMDQSQALFYRYLTNATGGVDSTRIKASETTQSTAFRTPFTIHGFRVDLTGTLNSQDLDHPVTRTFISQTDTSQRYTRTFARSATNQADIGVNFSLPGFLRGSLNVTPSVSFDNVYSGSYFVQSAFSGGSWVHQRKRPSFSLSVAPTLFALFPGIGPITRIRHSVTPRINFSYAPAADVPAAYLAAINHSPTGFLGSLARKEVSVGLSQVFEGKFRSDTSTSGEGRKIKLLSLDFSALTWNFQQAKETKGTGLTTGAFQYTAASDLLPGFTFSSTYSLFQGDVQSDTARFKPFRTGINASFTLNGQTGIVGAIARLFGHAPATSGPPRSLEQTEQDQLASRLSSMPVAGSYARDQAYSIDDTQGWSSRITFQSSRQRPPVGGRVINFDPTLVCSPYASNPVLFDQCQQNALLNPQTTVESSNDVIGGGVFVRVPPTETLQAQSTFHITQKWAASWGTIYDVVNHAFGSNQITLQRDLHDWRAFFTFSQAANGNSYFSFMIGNKAQPDLKFNYDKPTFRQQDLQ